MGRGNACVWNPYEGLYYVDFDDLTCYIKESEEEPGVYDSRLGRDISFEEMNEWQYDEAETDWMLHDFEEKFIADFTEMFPSFSEPSKRTWVSRDERAVLENELFYIVFEDNEWSLAVKLLQKENPYYVLDGLQKKHYQRYLEGMRDCLFKQFDEIGIYGGAWTSGTIRKADFAA